MLVLGTLMSPLCFVLAPQTHAQLFPDNERKSDYSEGKGELSAPVRYKV